MNEPILQLDLPGIKKVRSGKVREVFDLGDRFLLVASDRISAFDVIMPGLGLGGRRENGLGQFGRIHQTSG